MLMRTDLPVEPAWFRPPSPVQNRQSRILYQVGSQSRKSSAGLHFFSISLQSVLENNLLLKSIDA